MAQQYEIGATGLSGTPYRIEVYNKQYTGSTVTQLLADNQMIRFEGGQRERVGIEPLWGKEARINVRTDKDLSPLFGLQDRDAEVRVYRTDTSSLVWKGFILTDFFQDEPRTALPGVELRAVDGLTTLEGDSFDALSGVSDSDIDDDGSFISYTDLFTGVLSTLYDSPLDVEFAVEWYPDADGQLSSSDNPLRYSGARPDVYYDSDDGAWFDQQSALGDALKSQGLEIRQAVIGGELTWLVAQPTALSTSSVKTWRYAPDGTEDSASPFSRDLSLDLSNAPTNRPTREFERRSGSVSVTHDHAPIDNLVSNGGFESIGDWQITGSASNPSYYAEREKYSNLGSQFPPQTQNNKYAIVFEYNSQGTDFPLSQDLGEIIGLPQGSAFTLKQTFLQNLSIFGGLDEFSVRLNVGPYWLKEETRKVQKDADPGTGSVFVGEINSKIPSGSIIPVTNDPANLNNEDDHSAKATIRLTEPVTPGDGELTGEISGGLKSGQIIRYPAWTTTQSRLPIAYWKISQGVFAPISVRAPTVLEDGTEISGQSKIEYGAKHSGTNNLPLVHAVLDNVELSVGLDGSKLKESTREASVEAAGQSRNVQVLLSSGPTLENESRVKGVGPSSEYQATHWGIGVGGGSLSLAGLQARERLRYLRQHLERQQLTVYARDKSPVVTGEEVVQWDGKTWRIAEFSSDPYNGEIGLTLIQHADEGTTDLTIETVRDTEGGGTTGGGGTTSPATGGGGGVSSWDDLTGELSGPVPFDATDGNGNPVPRGADFLGTSVEVRWERDPSGGVALRVRDVTNGNDLLETDEGGLTDVPALNVQDTLTIPTKGDGTGQYIGEADFQLGDYLQRDTSTDPDTVDVTIKAGTNITIESDGTINATGGTGSPTDILEGGTEVVPDATDVDFASGDFDITNPATGEAAVALANDTVTIAGNAVSLGGSTSIAHSDLGSIGSDDHHTKYTDSEAVNAVGASTPFANTDLSNSSVTVAGNSVPLGGSTSIAHGDLSDAPASAHHTKTTSASDLTDVSADSTTDAHHTRYTDSEAVSALQVHDGANVNADTLDGYEGSDLAALAKDETVTGDWTFSDTIAFPDNSEGRIKYDQSLNGKPLYFQRAGSSAETAMTIKGTSVLVGDAGNPSYALDVSGTINASSDGYFGGSVGIGTTSPDNKLDVAGTVRINDNALYLRDGTDNNHFIGYDQGSGVDGPDIRGFSGGSLGTTNGDASVLSWFSNGHVGIGTTSPSYDLEVSGRAQATTLEATDTLLVPEK